MRTLRELGVGLGDIKRVLTAEVSLAEIAAAHALALDAQIRSLRLQRAVPRAVARSTDPEELERMSGLTTLTVDARRRMLEEDVDAMFAGQPNPVADRLRQGAPELPEDPTPGQIAAWVELAELLRDPEYIETSRRMARPGRDEGAEPAGGHPAVAAIGEHAAAADCTRAPPRRSRSSSRSRLRHPAVAVTGFSSPSASRRSPTLASSDAGRSSGSSPPGRGAA